MTIWNKLKSELDRAGRAAQGALDEGKLRLEIFRARQLVDRAAQSLGYAVYRARTDAGATVDEAAVTRLVDAIRERERDLLALEDRMRDLTGRTPPRDDVPPDAGDEGGGSAAVRDFDAQSASPDDAGSPPSSFQANEGRPPNA